MFFELTTRITSLFYLSLLLLSGAVDARAQDPNRPILNDGAAQELSTAGFFTLQWVPPLDAGVDPIYEVQKATSADFREPARIYHGRDRAMSMSGKSDGFYYYRVRTAGGEWSDPLEVLVQHHRLSHAVGFLVLGAFIFLATTLLVLLGNRRDRGDDR